MNRSTKELDIDSYLPWEGKVVVSVKQPIRLATIWLPGPEGAAVQGYVVLCASMLNGPRIAGQASSRYRGRW